MALPLMHTFSRNATRDAVNDHDAYANLRIHGMASNMNPALPWSTVKQALATSKDSDKSAFGSFSATCFYFGTALSDRLAAAAARDGSNGGGAPPIGLVHTAFGGSTIEQWLSNETAATCTDAGAPSSSNQKWHDSRVLPYVDTTIKGWVWYQGENDMHNYFGARAACLCIFTRAFPALTCRRRHLLVFCFVFMTPFPPPGNSALQTGYSCLMVKLVAEWRALWSAEPGTTDPFAPFGLVTLAPSGSEGGASIGTMRWAQTAGFGATPNKALPNVFTAQVRHAIRPLRRRLRVLLPAACLDPLGLAARRQSG